MPNHMQFLLPLPLCFQVAEELKRMEKAGVVSKVPAPTEWCAGMVVVPKKNKQVSAVQDIPTTKGG